MFHHSPPASPTPTRQPLFLCISIILMLVLGVEMNNAWAKNTDVVRSAQFAQPVRHTVLADGHPLTVWSKNAHAGEQAVLLVHGRTWSALPDFDLHSATENLSLMDGLAARGYAVYAVDLRGYGQTPRDVTKWLTPNRARRRCRHSSGLDCKAKTSACKTTPIWLVDGFNHFSTCHTTPPRHCRVTYPFWILA